MLNCTYHPFIFVFSWVVDSLRLAWRNCVCAYPFLTIYPLQLIFLSLPRTHPRGFSVFFLGGFLFSAGLGFAPPDPLPSPPLVRFLFFFFFCHYREPRAPPPYGLLRSIPRADPDPGFPLFDPPPPFFFWLRLRAPFWFGYRIPPWFSLKVDDARVPFLSSIHCLWPIFFSGSFAF